MTGLAVFLASSAPVAVGLGSGWVRGPLILTQTRTLTLTLTLIGGLMRGRLTQQVNAAFVDWPDPTPIAPHLPDPTPNAPHLPDPTPNAPHNPVPELVTS